MTDRTEAMDALIAQDADMIDVEPVACRYGFDGYGWQYIDSGSGSDWMTRHPDAEPLYTRPPVDAALLAEVREALEIIAIDGLHTPSKNVSLARATLAKLEGALRDISAECGECGGYGTYPAEETVTGKVLWWDCSSPVCKAGDSSGSEAARKQHVLRRSA